MNKKQLTPTVHPEMYIYIAVGITGLLLTAGCLAYKFYLKDYIMLPECWIHRITGIYCPACGGTRAVLSLFEGRVVESLLFHPAVIYGAGLWCLYMGINTVILLFTRDWDKMIHFSGRYVLIGVLLLAVNFVMKNV